MRKILAIFLTIGSLAGGKIPEGIDALERLREPLADISAKSTNRVNAIFRAQKKEALP